MATSKVNKVPVATIKGAMVPNLGLEDKGRQQLITLLNKRLADAFLLYTKTRNYHWNITGPQFIALHELLQDQYEDLAESVDEFAERVRKLGGFAFGTLDEFKQNSIIEEQPGVVPGWQTMLRNLVADHEAIIRQLRQDAETSEKLGDTFTNDFVIGKAHDHETMAWKLRAHLENVGQ